MYTKQDLIKDIEKMNIDPCGTVFIHSSMKAVGEVEGGADTVIDAWIEYMKDGLLIFPTHTWKQINAENNIFDSRTEPVCVGILPNLFMKRDNVYRSLHPTHSVAAIGKEAELYIANEEKIDSPCARNGCYGKLVDRNASIVFLGCPLTKNTFIHGVEEWNNVPNRVKEITQEFFMIDKNGQKYSVDMHRHACFDENGKDVDVSSHYDKLQPPFEKLDAIYYGKFGSADCVVGNAVKMADITTEFLQKNIDLFINNEPIPKDWY